MNTIFTGIGNIIMTKTDIENLKNYYNSYKVENNSNDLLVENSLFNYFQDNCEIILDNITPLTVIQLKKMLRIGENNQIMKNHQPINNNETFDDNDSILSNPFFTTLKPID